MGIRSSRRAQRSSGCVNCISRFEIAKVGKKRRENAALLDIRRENKLFGVCGLDMLLKTANR